MKTRIGLCWIFLAILGIIAGGNVSVEALEPRTNIQKPSKAVVPNVTGIPSDLALQILQLAGFDGKIQRGLSRSLTVESQEPKAGALAATDIIIVLGVGGATLKTSVAENKSDSATVPETKQTVGIQGVRGQSSPNLELPVTPQQANIKPIMAWYPQRFLTGATDAQTRGGPKTLGNKSSASGVPIILAPTQGWQYGWTH